MVKGISRRVVVIDSPDQRYFEQAIFLVRNDAAGQGVTAQELVEEARPGGPQLRLRGSRAADPGLEGVVPGGVHPDGGRRHRPGMADCVAGVRMKTRNEEAAPGSLLVYVCYSSTAPSGWSWK